MTDARGDSLENGLVPNASDEMQRIIIGYAHLRISSETWALGIQNRSSFLCQSCDKGVSRMRCGRFPGFSK